MTRKPRVLVFIDWYLPGSRSGGPVQSCANLIAHLKDEFDFSVVTRNVDYMSSAPYANIKSDQWNELADGTRVYYFSPGKLSKKGIYSLLKTEDYDRVYLNGIFSRYFTLTPLRYFMGMASKKVIVSSRGMLADSALAIKSRKKSLFLFFAKQFNLFRDVLFHATNEQEADSVRKVFGKNALIHIAPNLSENSQIKEWKAKARSANLLKLVNVARISPEKNIKYALEVLRDVKCNVQFDLYGPVYSEVYWSECKKIISSLPKNISVNYKGSLESNKVSETISQYDLLFLPTQGENFGHVILQAMSVGTPVIISNKTMWNDLQSKKAGWDIPLSESRKFVSVIENCAAMSQAEYDAVSKGAFEFGRVYMGNKESIELNRQLFLK